jgi:hypothetical protein
MRKPLAVSSSLFALALALCAPSVLAGEAGSDGSGAQEAGDEAGFSEGGPVTMPIDASIRVPDTGSADAGAGGTSGAGNSGCRCAAVGLDRANVVMADFGALVLGVSVLLRRRTKPRRDR